MGWYIVIKTIKGHRYRYRQRTWREGKHVRTQSICLGREDALAAGAEPVIWRRKEGARVVKWLQRAVRAHGFAAEMVGSVGTAGQSSKDLDVLLTATGPMNTEKALAAIDAMRKTYPVVQCDDDIVGFADELGRTVEIFLGDVPERVWGSAKFRDQMWAWINADAARFGKAKESTKAADRVPALERELRALYAQAGSGLIAGETLPAKPSPDDILDFGEQDKSFAERLASWRQDVDALTGQSKIRKAFAVVRAELELSEAGYRVIGDDAHQQGGTGVHGVPSTFPKWVPDRLRRKKLFDRLMPALDAENISYPARRSASRQRDLYHLILDRVDHLAGIDTARIREKIMRAYGQSQPDDA